jgi:hypothetical protein
LLIVNIVMAITDRAAPEPRFRKRSQAGTCTDPDTKGRKRRAIRPAVISKLGTHAVGNSSMSDAPYHVAGNYDVRLHEPRFSYHQAQLRYRLFLADISGFLEEHRNDGSALA